MRATSAVVLFVVALMGHGNSVWGQTGASSSRETCARVLKPQMMASVDDLQSQIKTFTEYTGYFSKAAKSEQGDDVLSAFELSDDASTSQGVIVSAFYELMMYDSVTCIEDRQTLKGFLKESLEAYSATLDTEITSVSMRLPLLKSSELTETATRMRNDLRTAQKKLDGILFELK